MSPELKERLDAVQAELAKRGVVDLKLDWAKDAPRDTESRALALVTFMEAMLDGKSEPVFGINDSDDPEVRAYFEEKRQEYMAKIAQ